jgi:hypothetical protein
MLTKVPDSFLEKITIEQDEIILNGPPRSLRGKMNLHNQSDSAVRIRSFDLRTPANVKDHSGINAPLFVNTKLRSGERRVEGVSLSLAPDTPPGTYESFISVGGKECRVKLVVQPTIAIEVDPTEFTFQGTAPGTRHTAAFTLTNMGNLPFQIPQISHVAPLDMDMLCRAFGVGFRKSKEDGFTQTMDLVTQNLKENLPGWAKADVKEAGEILPSGRSMLVHLDVTMPDDSVAGQRL